MADRRYHVASISRQFREPIYWNAHAPSSFDHAHWGYHSVFKQIRRCSVDGRKRYKNDKCGRISFLKRSKTAPFSFENGLVWTGPIKRTANVLIKLFNFLEWRYKKEQQTEREERVPLSTRISAGDLRFASFSQHEIWIYDSVKMP